jgi:hypothetical protein
MAILSTLLSYLSSHPSPLRLPQTSQYLSQQAPIFLSSSDSSKDTQETWIVYEQLLLSCLRTGDDASAKLCLERLSDRFGRNSPRISALVGLYEEATAKDVRELESVLKGYQDILKEDPTNMVCTLSALGFRLAFPLPQIASQSVDLTNSSVLARKIKITNDAILLIADRETPHRTPHIS